MSRICVVLSCLCVGGCLFMCLCDGLHVLCVYRFRCFVLCALLCYVIVVVVRFWCVRFVCGVWCCCLLFHWFVARVCVVVVLFSCVCYGLNAFHVCDCMLYAPSWRCYFLFV